MVAVAAGRFRESITIEQPDPDATAGPGGKVDLSDDANWCQYTTDRAEVLAITAKEQIYSQQVTASFDYRVTLRMSEAAAGITHRMRVRWGCRKLNIGRVVPIGSPARIVELGCVEVE